jgi:hypothetical protein
MKYSITPAGKYSLKLKINKSLVTRAQATFGSAFWNAWIYMQNKNPCYAFDVKSIPIYKKMP